MQLSSSETQTGPTPPQSTSSAQVHTKEREDTGRWIIPFGEVLENDADADRGEQGGQSAKEAIEEIYKVSR